MTASLLHSFEAHRLEKSCSLRGEAAARCETGLHRTIEQLSVRSPIAKPSLIKSARMTPTLAGAKRKPPSASFSSWRKG
jgi:hypothetical protein